MELQRTGIFGNNDGIKWVPLSDEVTFLNDITLFIIERSTIRHVERTEYDVGIRIDKTNFRQTADNHLTLHVAIDTILNEGYRAKFVELKSAVVLSYDTSIGRCITCHTTGVERTKSKLCSRLTNGLCRNDTDSFAELNHTSCGKVTTVTLHTNAMLALASEHRTNLNHFYW